jgi:ankyrin repeat protein
MSFHICTTLRQLCQLLFSCFARDRAFLYKEKTKVPRGVDSVIIHPSVKYLRCQAFEACANLTQIDIPSSVLYIGDEAFYRCRSLSVITFPDTMKSIGFKVFTGCVSLTTINIPQSVKKIGFNAFDSCRSLRSIVIPSSVTKIEPYTFHCCSSLTSVMIPPSVITIGASAFSDCSSLSVIAIPSMSVVIDVDAFRRCDILKYHYKYNDGFRTISQQKQLKVSLQNRFVNLPLHQACYSFTSSSKAQIQIKKLVRESIESSQSSSTKHLTSTDEFGMTALHILCSHPNATPNMFKLLTASPYTSSITTDTWTPSAIQQERKHIYCPLAMFMRCRGFWHRSQEVCHYTTKRCCPRCRLPLDKALKQGIRGVDLECLFSLDIQLGSEQRLKDKKTGFYPFLQAASYPQCGLDTVYLLLRRNADLIY